MSELRVLQTTRPPRRRRRRRLPRRHVVFLALATLALGLALLLALMDSRASGPPPRPARAAAPRPRPERSSYGIAAASRQLNVHLKLPLRSGLLFDVRTGRVLWARDAQRELPIASLTKMMTALVVTDRDRSNARARITPQAVHFSGSGVGLLPLGKRVPVETLLYGLLLPSGNDAAIALAQFTARTEARFVGMMNARARAMGLTCTHFTTASGILDQGNYSCASDLALMAHAVLTQRLLSRIVASLSAVLPFPIKGGKLYLYNNNPLLREHYPGADGVKTGYTSAAGQCLVAAARRGRAWLGVVLLHSANPPAQAEQLLNAGFAHGAA